MSPDRNIAVHGGRLQLGGCDAVELAATYGTPLYVLDEDAVRDACRRYRATLTSHYRDGRVLYAGKALLTKALCRIVHEEGLGLDVVSGGELYTALAAQFPPELIYFHGNNKSEDELTYAIGSGVGHVVADSADELQLLAALAREAGRTVNVLLRVTPGVEARTHSYVQTGQVDSKFGFPMLDDIALDAARRAAGEDGLRLVGYHCHIGSQITDLHSYDAAIDLMLDFMVAAQRATGVVAEQLNVGGGLGIAYRETDSPPTAEQLVRHIAAGVQAGCVRRNVTLPRLLLEPGRSIVGSAGTTLYSVGFIKNIPGVRTYVSVDGGMGDNPRVALYQARHDALLANKASAPRTATVSVAGKYCETGDMLLHDVKLPPPERGDVLAVFDTGAYNYSMASNYNRLPRPAMVLVGDGEHELIVRRETYADIVARDIVPERLRRTEAVGDDRTDQVGAASARALSAGTGHTGEDISC